MPRRRPPEEHVNHEAWAIPYGDLITLLLAFFVVMYAVSSLNEGKYRVLADALNAEFRGPQRSTEPIQIGEQQRVAAKGEGLLDKSALLEGAPAQIVAPPADTKTLAGKQSAPPRTTPEEEVTGNAAELNKVADEVEAAMSSLIRDGLVSVRRHGLWIEVEIKADILFSSGVATLSPVATSLLLPLGDALTPFPNPIRVEGHTDNVPISSREYPTNWELSAARAASVVRLFANLGVEPSRLTVIGLGEFRPLKSNATAEGRTANRRVMLVILGTDGLPAGTYGHQESEGGKPVVPATPPAGLPTTPRR
jgi:chemotaxis protein MotB